MYTICHNETFQIGNYLIIIIIIYENVDNIIDHDYFQFI